MNEVGLLLLANEAKYSIYFETPCSLGFNKETGIQTIYVKEGQFTWTFDIDIRSDYESLNPVKNYIEFTKMREVVSKQVKDGVFNA